MGDRNAQLTFRLTTTDRRYIRRIAKLRGITMADVVAEMVQLHREHQVDELRSTSAGVAITETKSAA